MLDIITIYIVEFARDPNLFVVREAFMSEQAIH